MSNESKKGRRVLPPKPEWMTGSGTVAEKETRPNTAAEGEGMRPTLSMTWKAWTLMKSGCLALLFWLAILLMILCLDGCRTVREATDREAVRKDSVYASLLDSLYHSKSVRDSIYVKDSIVFREKGDTIFSERWHVNYIERLRTDTVVNCHTDTLYRVVRDSVCSEIVREREPSKRERVGWFVTDAACTLVFVGVVWLLILLRKWLAKKRGLN